MLQKGDKIRCLKTQHARSGPGTIFEGGLYTVDRTSKDWDDDFDTVYVVGISHLAWDARNFVKEGS